ncbi:hypothetical protein TcasGA2_TC004808 [Tribolium castaneum]|uniref:HAT C-terminal dimerisation domain-containing protein n=1 Tax=Tribolium castaneum TaxID=7070 RepID=D6WBG6_TRICA|nr:hypothetical protein TcasGA2_TC004808 [Tribolium castaneum]
MEHIPSLLRSVCPDSAIVKDIKCSRTKATAITNECMALESLECLQKHLQESGNTFSLIIDETTDVSVKKSLAIVIRYCFNNLPRDRVFGIVKVEESNAESLFNIIIKLLKDNKIDLKDMLGFAADNASVMMGHISGIKARFHELNPNIFVLGCTCHSLHLAASAACSKIPKDLEEFVRNLYNYFSNSPKRINQLEEFQKFLDLKPFKMIRPCQTRWLSLQAVMDRIILLWDSLQLHFTNFLFESLRNALDCETKLLEGLRNPVYKMYLLFLSYILGIVNQIILQFQSEGTQIHLLYNKFTALYNTVLRNYIKKSVIDKTELPKIALANPDYFVELDNLYMGANVDLFIQQINIDATEDQKFRTNILSFYIELANQIRKRFNFEDKFLMFLSTFEPKVAMSGEIPSIVKSNLYFGNNIITNLEQLNNEWRLLPDIACLKRYTNFNFIEFWIKVFNLKNEINMPMFPNLTKLVKAIMCLPHSSAAADRIFSKLNLIKSDSRNRLSVETCNSIILSTELIEGTKKCFNWEPQKSLLEKNGTYGKQRH